MAGCVPVYGRLLSVALFELDECMAPVYETNSGYVDPCFAAFSSSDNMDDGEAFTRKCASGATLYHEDGKSTLQSVQVELDLNAEPAKEFMTKVGLVEEIASGTGENKVAVGWTRVVNAEANLLLTLWQEVLGSDACADGGEKSYRLHMYPLKGARLTTEGDMGSQDSYMRITGTTVANAALGQGPYPFLSGESSDEFFGEDELNGVTHHAVLDVGVAGPPEDCGVITLTAPVSP